MDEATPHIHEVQSFWYMEKGMRMPGVDKCLEQMGIPLPDPSKPKSQKNNREATYTAMCRDKLIQIAKDMGLEIETEPKKGQKHLNKVDAAARQMLELMGRAEDKIDTFLLSYEDYDGTVHKKAIKMDMSDDIIPEFDFNPYVLESKLEYFGSIVENAVANAEKAKLAQKQAETATEEAKAAAEKLIQDATAKSGDIIRTAYKEAQNVLNKSDFMKGYETAKADTEKAITEGKLIDSAKYKEVLYQLQTMTQLYNADHLKLAELEEALKEEKEYGLNEKVNATF
ncbi:MAG: hypothetical protein E7307_03535 [Butyrivibrio sp.]|nr:hypothetical protein [Butyrivibrio sp.]